MMTIRDERAQIFQEVKVAHRSIASVAAERGMTEAEVQDQINRHVKDRCTDTYQDELVALYERLKVIDRTKFPLVLSGEVSMSEYVKLTAEERLTLMQAAGGAAQAQFLAQQKPALPESAIDDDLKVLDNIAAQRKALPPASET